MSCASGYVASDMDDAVFKCLAPPGVPDETLPRCVLLDCTGQEFDGLDGIAPTCDGVGLGDNCGAEGADGEAETYPCVRNDSTSLKINNPLLRAHQSAVLPPSHQQVQDTIPTVSFAGRMHCHLRRELRG